MRLWTVESGFESLLPSNFQAQAAALYLRLHAVHSILPPPEMYSDRFQYVEFLHK